MTQPKHYNEVLQYVDSILSGEKLACKEIIEACQRFRAMLDNPKYELRHKDPEFVIGIIERTFVHDQGERLDGTPLRGQPFLLEPWQKFIVYNLVGFYHRGTRIRVFHEAFIFIPRKNGKTRFVAALAWALALLERRSGSKLYIVGAALRQALQSFGFILFNIRQMGEEDSFRILDNNQEHSISGEFDDGSIYIEALAANPEKHDSLNSNIQILDELHAYKNATQYNVIRESGKAYTNKLCLGITTAGDSMTSFCYNRLKYCQKILDGTVKDEQYFVFIAKADEAEDGSVDYTSAVEHEKANPNYGVTIRPDDIMNDALQAQNDPQQRKDFLAKSLNVYTSSMKSYFNVEEFRASDRKFSWTLEDLAKLPIIWYGGADLSRVYDLTAAALYGTYNNVDIAITHAFFPITQAHAKAEEDNIPLFGWQDDGWLTMVNAPTVEYLEVVKWFAKMREKGFKIKVVGFDRKFAEEFVVEMTKARFKVVDTPQLYVYKSQGFRRIEAKAKRGEFCYLGSEAFEYCLQNVKAVEGVDDVVKYDKIGDNYRIDLFDAAVFAAMQMLKSLDKKAKVKKWLGKDTGDDGGGE